jgi:serine phosphatase RsbU (regulator of sigma subunit)
LANTINNIAAANLKANQLELAEQNARKALLLAKSTGTALEIKQASWILYQVFKKKLRFDKALEMFETYTMINDSILRVNNQNEILNNDYKAQFQLDSALAEENSRMLRLEINAQDAKIKQAQTEKLALFGGLGAGFIFSFLLYNRYKVAKKQKTIIEEKNSKLDLQNRQISIRQKEIADSIQYAKRLQDAMLPDMKRLNTLFGEFSLLYLPKDVVSGDFYWFEEKDGLLYLAVADCTGHGVPGAMVSMVCYNMLKRAVFEYNLFDPADILGKTRELVIDHFSQKDDSVNDGMDIALCCFDLNKMTLLFSGANMDLHIVTKSDHEKADVRRIKGNKQPVGVHMDQSDFQTHRITLSPGDRVILYSDGLTDQFGGSAGKKLKTSGLQRFIEKESFSEGNFERSLHQFIYDWKGNHEQVDDMCFVSVKVSHVRG